jgi:hypothetical protein
MLPNVSDPQTDYGLPKANRDTLGPVDPSKECDFAEWERLAVDMAAACHVLPRAIVYVTNAGAPAVADYDSVWGDAVGVTPTVTDNGVGDTTLTWTAGGYADLNPTPARRVTRAPAFRFAHATSASATGRIGSVVWTANTVRVYTTTHAGAADDCDFCVFVY